SVITATRKFRKRSAASARSKNWVPSENERRVCASPHKYIASSAMTRNLTVFMCARSCRLTRADELGAATQRHFIGLKHVAMFRADMFFQHLVHRLQRDHMRRREQRAQHHHIRDLRRAQLVGNFFGGYCNFLNVAARAARLD